MPRNALLPRLSAGKTTLIAVALITLLLYFYGEDLVPRTWQMNGLLKGDPVLAEYPYDFRVVNFLGGTVTVTRPYTDASGPLAFLTKIDPSLEGLPPEDPAVREAEEALKAQELHAVALLMDQPDVESVIWHFDRAWYTRNDVPLPPEALAPGRR